MALVTPRDMTTGVNWERADLTPQWQQELSRSRSRVQARDLGDTYWRAEFESVPMEDAAAERLHAEFLALKGAIHTFYAHPARRPRPHRWDGENLAGVSLNAIRSDNAGVKLAGLPPDFPMTAGDFFSLVDANGGKELLCVASGAKANGSGVTPFLDIVPPLAPTVVVGAAATLINPLVEMRLVPETLDMPLVSGRLYRIAFEAQQA